MITRHNSTHHTALALALGLLAAAAAGYGYWQRATARAPSIAATASAAERRILYYRDPGGAPFWSAVPKKDAQGRAYLPVYDDAEPSFDPPQKPASTAAGERKILFYRNPMGLPDTSPVPKKDPMGMDYIPVYEGEENDSDGGIKVNLDRVQRSGVRTAPVEARVLVRGVRAVGSVTFDERRLTIVTMRADGYIEDLFVNTTGQSVRVGEPLFRIYSADVQRAQIDYLIALDAAKRGAAGTDTGRTVDGAVQRLRNLAVPEERIRQVRETGANPRTIDWPSPASGVVLSKRVINGQRVAAGEELYRIADLSSVWVVADVAEADLADISPGTRATVTFRAYRTKPVEGVVTFIYPEVRTETRTARVRIEVPNADARLKVDMYADVVFHIGGDLRPTTSVPASAVIDNGKEQIVLIAKGDGRFEPRPVRLGRRGDSDVEVVEGLREGEEVVTTATFLIDAESNLRAALQTFKREDAPR